jgi:hypothetical protein
LVEGEADAGAEFRHLLGEGWSAKAGVEGEVELLALGFYETHGRLADGIRETMLDEI